ncbi:unnamed protein product [Rhizoctonia solani]|uniref:Uncharacterized protein n=1 Tax=Rhizoctonia solani TaxID=456999 RepID=A0A8H3C1I0_9AGAM|nr:unnamed protein product [Rhizoctonia solani]
MRPSLYSALIATSLSSVVSGLLIPRAEPITCKLQVLQSSKPLGYLSSKLNEFGEYGILTNSATEALEVTFTPESTSVRMDLNVTGATVQMPVLGGIVGFFNEGDDLESGSYHYAYIGLTSQTSVGATPQKGINSFDQAQNYDRKIESAIWSFNSTTKELIPQWVNTDNSTPRNIVLFVDKQNVLVITADKRRFEENFREEFEAQGATPLEVVGIALPRCWFYINEIQKFFPNSRELIQILTMGISGYFSVSSQSTTLWDLISSGLAPFASQTTCKLQVYQGTKPLGYLSSQRNSYGEYGALQDSAAGALSVTFSASRSKSTGLNLRVVGASADMPMLGGIIGFTTSNDNLASGSHHYAYVGLTSQTISGSIPVQGSNSFDKVQNFERKVQSAIWAVDLATKQLTAQWINTNRATPRNYLLYVADEKALVFTADKTEFKRVMNVSFSEVTLNCVA